MRLTVRRILGGSTMHESKKLSARIEVMQIDDHKVVMKFPTASDPNVVSDIKHILFGQKYPQKLPRKFDKK